MSDPTQTQKILAYLSLSKCGIYLIFHYLFQFYKNISRNFNGASEIPSKHARLQKIVGKYNSRQDIPRREDFVTVDAGFISLEELKAPQWTVYSLDTVNI
uniref:Uncharacterized protein n=1 Tax=Panagrolaimus davidi TaxID=227884 RepID=A0A914Q1U4_9BILA